VRAFALSQVILTNLVKASLNHQSTRQVAQGTFTMSSAAQRIKFLTAAESQSIDEELFSTGGFSVDQLMELAGLSVAQAIYEEYSHSCGTNTEKLQVLVLCGPGNNGGDGLVAARHLNHFGMKCTVHYPKKSSKDLFARLVTQAQQAEVTFIDHLPSSLQGYDVVVDALFGFSFKGEPRAPFDSVLKLLKDEESKTRIVSVDIPSGWNVDTGPSPDDSCFTPSMLVSLTAPKKGSANFRGVHYLGGRFVPSKLAGKYGLDFTNLYSASSQIVKL